jgi:ribosome-associated protein
MKNNDEIEGRGRSAKKREAKAVEQLAQRLADLPEAELATLPKDPELSREIALVRSTSGHSSRKRQIKHLAGLLRRDNEKREKIAEALDGQALSQRRETLAFHHLEELRDRLCNVATFATALAEVRAAYPQIDDGKLARLAGSVHEHGDKRAAREIFRRLRQAEEASGA